MQGEEHPARTGALTKDRSLQTRNPRRQRRQRHQRRTAAQQRLLERLIIDRRTAHIGLHPAAQPRRRLNFSEINRLGGRRSLIRILYTCIHQKAMGEKKY
jgi:hypothetical protein